MLGSIIATIICAILVFIFPKIRRRITRRMFNFTDVGIVCVYSSPESHPCIEDMEKEIVNAKELKIIACRGSFLARNPFMNAYSNANIAIKVLLPDVKAVNPDWIESHYKWIHNYKCADDRLPSRKGAIEANIDVLKTRKNVEIKLFNTVHVGRFIITENAAYFTPYCSGITSPNTPTYKYASNSTMYSWCHRFFEEVWNNSQHPIS